MFNRIKKAPVAGPNAQAFAAVKDRIEQNRANGTFELFAVFRDEPELNLEASGDVFVVKKADIDKYIYDISKASPRWATKAMENTHTLTERILRRLAPQLSSRMGLDKATFVQAFYFPMWIKLTDLRVMRRISKDIIRDAKDRTIVLDANGLDKKYFSLWGESDLIPFYLSHQITRLGGRPLLAFQRRSGLQHALTRSETLTFSPDRIGRKLRFDVSGEVLLASEGIRNLPEVKRRIQAQSREDFSRFDVRAKTRATTPKSLKLKFSKLENQSMPPFGSAVFSAKVSEQNTARVFADLAAHYVAFANSKIKTLCKDKHLRTAHICDHPFFASALAARAVVAEGGTISLWPHGANTYFHPIHDKANINHIQMATKTSANYWRAADARPDISIPDHLFLDPYKDPWPYSPDEPLNVIVIGGAHKLNSMPTLDTEAHFQAYRDLFHHLDSLGDTVNVHIKAKPAWESYAQISAFAPQSLALSEITAPPTEMRLPNLVFITVSCGSSALLEGMSRGIPAFIVSQFDAWDYLPIPQKASASETVAILRGLNSQAAWNSFIEDQSAWYRNETGPTDTV